MWLVEWGQGSHKLFFIVVAMIPERKTFVFPPQPFIILASFVQEQQKSKKQPARLERRIKHDLPGQYSAPKLIRIKQHSVLIDFEILNHQEHQKTSWLLYSRFHPNCASWRTIAIAPLVPMTRRSFSNNLRSSEMLWTRLEDRWSFLHLGNTLATPWQHLGNTLATLHTCFSNLFNMGSCTCCVSAALSCRLKLNNV